MQNKKSNTGEPYSLFIPTLLSKGKRKKKTPLFSSLFSQNFIQLVFEEPFNGKFPNKFWTWIYNILHKYCTF
jgi:hypothetical protein